MFHSFFISILYYFFHSVLCQNDHVYVHSSAGNIIGLLKTSTFKSTVYRINTFLGIPYAEPPLGNLRFSKPVKKARFSVPFSANQYGPACPQKPELAKQWIPGKPYILEDCLSLNVFVPANANTSNLPVMVWFHGGAFVIGQSSIYDASNLSGFGNVVVVTANYRLGPIGFLATDDDTSKGNYGLWDQRMVIQWVHDNIASFGGDPHRVTLFGESAGGASSFYQAMYPPNKGLIHRIISESGTAICPWAYGDKSTVGRFAKLLGLKLNCSIATNSELLSCLRTKPYEDLISNAQVGTQEDEIYRPEWTPVVDNEFIKMLPPDNYLYPETMYADVRDALADLDLLIGVNDGDGGFITMVSLFPFVQSKVTPSYRAINVVNNYVTNSMLTDRFGHTLESVVDVMSFVYTNWSASETNNTYLQKVLDMATDYQFFIPAYVSARALFQLQAPERHTYKYLFTHRSSFGKFIPWVPGAGHGDEIPYVFGFPSSMQTGLRFPDTVPPEELALSERVMTYWTNFAKTGDPNKSSAVSLVWPTFDNHSEHYLNLNSRLSIGNKMEPTRTAFWTYLAPKMLKLVPKGYSLTANSSIPTYVLG